MLTNPSHTCLYIKGKELHALQPKKNKEQDKADNTDNPY